MSDHPIADTDVLDHQGLAEFAKYSSLRKLLPELAWDIAEMACWSIGP